MRRTWTVGDFEIDKKIGDGQYSKVYLAKEKNVNKTVAIKVICNKIFGKKITEEQFRKEIKIQYKLQHANILKLFGYFDDDKARYIVLEYCECGEMYADIRSCNTYTNERAATYIYQLAHALDFCFENGVIHRDIKSENILISSSGAAKLADFGWSTQFKNSSQQTFCGTIDYLSPEVLQGRPQNEKVDIWCLGVLLCEMLTKETPFFNLNKMEFYNNISLVKFNISGTINMLAKFFIINILRKDIFERLTAKQIILHPYVDKFAEKSLTECRAAFNQWSTVKEKKQETWSLGVTFPIIDFNNEAPNDMDINSGGSKGSYDESFSLLKEIAKKEAPNGDLRIESAK